MATLGNPDSPPTSRLLMHSHQPSALGHTRFHAHGSGGPGCGHPRDFPAPAPSPRCSPPDARPAPGSPPGPWELSCSANVSRGLASAVLAAPPPCSPPGTHSIFLSEFRSRAQTLSIASFSEPLEGSPRWAPTRRPKPIPEDLRAQCRQRCTGARPGGGPQPLSSRPPAEWPLSSPTGPTDMTPAPTLAPSSLRVVSAPRDRAPAPICPWCPGTRTRDRSLLPPPLLTLRALCSKGLLSPAALTGSQRTCRPL